mmetsp:Transcript_46873/g.123886  ORF Transcript_46873/g.123886 Transcript_46873/m.123886 type:complete len:211 (-) Transcript_46873:1216-1848(-)
MSRLSDGPCRRKIPVMNSSTAIDPPVPSFRMWKISGSSSMSMSITFIMRTKATFSKISVNSSSDTLPLLSVSISWKAWYKAVMFLKRAISFFRASASLSVDLNTRCMTTAVITLTSRMPATIMNVTKRRLLTGISSVMGRTILAQSSNVMIWKRVNMADTWVPNRTWTSASSAKVSDFTMVSSTATAKPQWTKPMTTRDHHISLMHPVMP